MTMAYEDGIATLAAEALGQARCHAMVAILEPMIPARTSTTGQISRAEFAAALNIVLFADLLDRVPTAAAYVEDVRAGGQRIRFDHGAIRTIRLPQGDTGALPMGERAFRRILEPLGYEDAALYPLPALHMTGRAYRHRDFPATIPQFFVSELHVDQFDDAFATAATRVFGSSRDPLDSHAEAVLGRFGDEQTVPFDDAARALPTIVAAFDRQHDMPTVADYDILKQSSKEAAWIATEGNRFNHATDRVPDVVALAEQQKAIGRPMKDNVEVSRSGRVRQTACRADMVERGFLADEGREIRMMVPGSFYEFISRDIDPETGALDLSFDSGNATGIFHMTKGA